jgi:uncharacterized repeat protein (TIGR02543 family)
VPTIRVTIDRWTRYDYIPYGSYWEAEVNVGYSVTYNANGGTGAPAYQIKSGFISEPLTLSTTKPTRTGYNFSSWNTAKDGTGTTYASGATYSTNAVATLYAQWTAKTYTLSIDPNGGYYESNGSTAIATSTKAYGSTTTIGVRKRDGYTLIGYTIKRTSDGSTSNIGGATVTFNSSTKKATFKQGSVSVTLVAQWQQNAASVYTVTYQSGYYGQYSAEGLPSAQTFTSGSSVTISSVVPILYFWTFLGWSTSSTATSPTYTGGDTFTPTGNVTLYAVWSKAITITYNANGGSGAPAMQTLGTVYLATTARTVSGKISSTVPTKSGYTFLGWSADPTATTATYQSGASVSIDVGVCDKVENLYAIWAKAITVTYNANGGAGAPSAQSGTIYNDATSYTFELSTVQPTKSGGMFLGWSPIDTATSASYFPGETATFTTSTTLYAVWGVVDWIVGITKMNVNGTWTVGIPWVNDNGTWKVGCGLRNGNN